MVFGKSFWFLFAVFVVVSFNNCAGSGFESAQFTNATLNSTASDETPSTSSPQPQAQSEPQVQPQPRPQPQMNPQPQPQPQPLPQSNGSWPNKPSGMTTILDDPFSNSMSPVWFNVYKTQAFANVSTAPVSGPTVFNTYLAAGSGSGNGEWGVNLKSARELYFGTWYSTNSDFVGAPNTTNKMMFIRNSSSVGTDNNFINWSRSPGQPGPILFAQQATYDNNHFPGVTACYTCGDGTGSFPANKKNIKMAAGSGWYRLEIYLKASTTKTSRDGIIRIWINGELSSEYIGANLSPNGFTEFILTHTWDNTSIILSRDLSKRWDFFWDHMIIAIR